MKKTIARWLASRAEHTARRIRRDLRDNTRRATAAATRADKRARGLRLYAAWSHKSYASHESPRSIEAAFDDLQRRLGTPLHPSAFNLQPSR
jgi:hypothetical protein